MHVTRRHLFRLGPVVLAAAVAPRKMFGAPQDGDRVLPMSKTHFQTLVGKSFTVESSSSKTTWLTLASIEEAAVAAPGSGPLMAPGRNPFLGVAPKTETFSLKFFGTGAPLTQGTYTLEHFSVGKIQLFIVPSGSSTYTAVINNLVEPLPSSYPVPQKKQRPVAVPPAA